MKTVIKSVFFMALGAMLLSCAEKPLDNEGGKQIASEGSVVSFTINNDPAALKSGHDFDSPKTTVIADLSAQTGIEGLVLEETVTSMDDQSIMPATKGTPVYSENFADVYAAGFNAIKVISSDGKDLNKFYPAVFVKREDSNLWYHEYAEKLAEEATFYFTAPAATPEYIGTPTAEDGAFTFALDPAKYPTTAVEQKDILFATSEVTPGKTANVKFYHTFAMVKFKQGGTDDKLQITKIEVSNLLTSGTCTVTPVDGKKSSEVSVWSQDEKSYADFSQTYDGKITYDEGEGYFGSSFYDAATDENNLNIGGDKKATTTFMCVPQSFSKTDANPVIVTITYTRNGETKTLTTDFSKGLNGKSWEPGKLYTYTFTITELGVKVEDRVSGDTKDNVVITNTGNTNGYIRAAVVANWVKDVDGEPVVLVSCDPRTEGTLTVSSDNWIPGSDGYFYYKYAVKGGNTTKQTFTYKTGYAPESGAYLEMDMIAQIVADRSVWGTVPGGLSNDVEE